MQILKMAVLQSYTVIREPVLIKSPTCVQQCHVLSLLGQQRVIKHTRVLLTLDTLVGKLLLKSNGVTLLSLLATGTYNPLPFFIVTVSLVTGTS